MRKFFFILVVFSLFVVSCDNLYNDVAEEKNDMQKLIFVNADGVSVDLTKDPYGITEWEGFSKVDLNLQTQQVPFHDGSVYLDGLLSERELSVTLAMNDEKNLEKRYRLRRELITILNPKLGEGTLIYTNNYTSKQIKVVPQTPLFENHNSNDSGTPKASLAWTACDPYWEDVEDSEVNFKIGEYPTITNNSDIDVPVNIQIFAQNEQNPCIENITTQQKIGYDGLLENTLHIDTNFGQKSCYTEKLSFNDVGFFSESYRTLCYSSKLNKVFVGGYDGIGRVSQDLINWSFVNITTGDIICSLYCETKEMFLVGTTNGIYTSSDGINWTQRTSQVAESIVYANNKNLFVALSTDLIQTSSDGISWTATSISLSYAKGITYAEDKELFVAVGSSIITSSDGINWTERLQVSALNSIVYAEDKSLFVAVGNLGKILKSSDGNTWEQDAYSTIDLLFVNYLNGNFICVGSPRFERITILKSEDAITWINCGSSNDNFKYIFSLYGIIFVTNFNTYIICGENDTIATSIDLINWNWGNSGKTRSRLITDICYSTKQKKYLTSGGIPLVSYDGKSWQPIETNFSTETMCYSEKLNIFCGGGTNYGYGISEDGINWTIYNGYNFKKIIYAEDKEIFVAIGGQGLNKIFTSIDGITWEQRYSDDGNIIVRNIVYSQEKSIFIVVGSKSPSEYSRFITSEDGINWTSHNFPYNLYCIIYNNEDDLFVTGGENCLFTSADGINWNSIEYSGTLSSLCYSKDMCITIGISFNGEIIASKNNINWDIIGKALLGGTIIYSEEANNFIIGGGSSNCGLLINVNYVFDENQISKLTKDSDMQFCLKKGSNIIRLTHESSDVFSARIAYRQKYIGV